MSKRALKQLSDGASTTNVGSEFHKLSFLSVKVFSNIMLYINNIVDTYVDEAMFKIGNVNVRCFTTSRTKHETEMTF